MSDDTNPLKSVAKDLTKKDEPKKPESAKVSGKGLVKVKNVFGRNVHTSIGKIPADEEGFMPIHEAEHDKRVVIVE